MELTHAHRLEVPLERAWAVLGDLDALAASLPGADLLVREGDTCRGTLTVKVGPLTLRHEGSVTMTWRDPEAHRAVFEVGATEVDGVGTLEATVNVTLSEAGDRTRVAVLSNVEATGRLAQYGPAVLTDLGARLLAGLVGRLEATVFAAEVAERRAASDQPPLDEPAPAEATRGRRRRRRRRRDGDGDASVPAPLAHDVEGDLAFDPPVAAAPEEPLPTWTLAADADPVAPDDRAPVAPHLTWGDEPVAPDDDGAAGAASSEEPAAEAEAEVGAEVGAGVGGGAIGDLGATPGPEPEPDEARPPVPPVSVRPVEPLVWKPPTSGRLLRGPEPLLRPASPHRRAAAARRIERPAEPDPIGPVLAAPEPDAPTGPATESVEPAATSPAPPAAPAGAPPAAPTETAAEPPAAPAETPGVAVPAAAEAPAEAPEVAPAAWADPVAESGPASPAAAAPTAEEVAEPEGVAARQPEEPIAAGPAMLAPEAPAEVADAEPTSPVASPAEPEGAAGESEAPPPPPPPPPPPLSPAAPPEAGPTPQAAPASAAAASEGGAAAPAAAAAAGVPTPELDPNPEPEAAPDAGSSDGAAPSPSPREPIAPATDRPIDVIGAPAAWSEVGLAQRAVPVAMILALLWILRRLFGSSDD